MPDPLSPLDLANRLDALELKAMDAEHAQATLDEVVLRHAAELEALRVALGEALRRLDALADGGGGAADDDAGGTLAEQLERERPPHY